MVCFTRGKQRNEGHKSGVDELLKCRQEGLIFVVYILSASQLITIDKKG